MALRAARRLENEASLDRGSDWLARVSAPLASPGIRDVLLGKSSGHALHPVLTDLPLGFWTSAGALDLLGGREARPAVQRLIGLGILSAIPTALAGLAEWRQAGTEERRVGVAHAALNTAAVVLYAASWTQRRSGRHRLGSVFSIAGSVLTSGSGYLGGHLSIGRKVGYRDPSLEDDEVGPVLLRPAETTAPDRSMT